MARGGDVLENAVTSERLTWRRTGAETGGEALEYELVFRPQGFTVREHLHPRQSERHEVVEGSLGLVLDGTRRVLEPGDSVVVPAGTPHRLVPVGADRVHAVFELRPALRSEELLETFFRLAAGGKVDAKGNPSLLEGARLARDFAAEGYATTLALAVQKVLLFPLAAVADVRSGPSEHVFVDEWDADAPIEPVFDALADGRTYPEWWRPVYLDVDAEGPAEVGQVSRQHFKRRLPYHLHTTSRIVELERPTRLVAEVEGDLRGRGVWTLTPLAGGGTHVRFDWRVHADRPLLRVLTPVLRPLFRWNHNYAISRAMAGLAPYARGRAERG